MTGKCCDVRLTGQPAIMNVGVIKCNNISVFWNLISVLICKIIVLSEITS